MDTSIVGTEISGLDVLRLGLVESTPGLVRGEDGNVYPGSGGPVGIIVPLLGALKSVSISVVVLSGVHGSSTIEVSLSSSVGNKETLVSVSGVAGIEVASWLVHSKLQHTSGIFLSDSSLSVRDGVSVSSISNTGIRRSVRVAAHVLNDKVAIHLGVSSATVLVGPLNGEERTFIEAHGRSIAVSSLGIVLRIVQSVSIVSVLVGLVQTVVGPSRVLHVKVCRNIAENDQKGQ